MYLFSQECRSVVTIGRQLVTHLFGHLGDVCSTIYMLKQRRIVMHALKDGGSSLAVFGGSVVQFGV